MSDYTENNELNEIEGFEEGEEMDFNESILGKPVHLVLDDETEMDTIVVAVFPVDNIPWHYIALLPVPENEDEEEEYNDVILYRFALGEDGSPELGNIESDAEYEAAADAFYDEIHALEEEYPFEEDEMEEE